MRTTIELFEEDEKELARTVELMREKRATVLRLAVRAGLPLVVARFQAPRPEGYFADAYKTGFGTGTSGGRGPVESAETAVRVQIVKDAKGMK